MLASHDHRIAPRGGMSWSRMDWIRRFPPLKLSHAFEKVRQLQAMNASHLSGTVIRGGGWRGRSKPVVGKARSRELCEALGLVSVLLGR